MMLPNYGPKDNSAQSRPGGCLALGSLMSPTLVAACGRHCTASVGPAQDDLATQLVVSWAGAAQAPVAHRRGTTAE